MATVPEMAGRLTWLKLPVFEMLAECGHLDPAKLGAHIKLAMIAWTRARVAIPNDERWICQRLGIDDAAFASTVRPVLAEYWTADGDDLILPWLQREAEDAAARSATARQKANSRWDAVKSAPKGATIHPLKTKDNF